jgi:molybdate transport system substrate-binding protein
MRKLMIVAAIAVAAIGLLFFLPPKTQAQSPEVRVLASNGVRSLLDELRPQSERIVGHSLAIQFGTSASLKELVEKGEAFDVAIMTSEAVDDLIKAGRVAPGTRAGIGRSGIGVGIRAGTPKPDIKTTESLKRTLLNARSITYAQDGASRPYIVRMFETLGIADQMKAKTVLEQGSVRAAARVTGGDAELLITLITEILPVQGMDLVGPLPTEFQSYVSFTAGVGTKAKNAEAAKALIAYLSGPGVMTTLRAKGLERK